MLWGLALATYERGAKTTELWRQIYYSENLFARNLFNHFSSWKDIFTWDLSVNTTESRTANLSFIKEDGEMITPRMLRVRHWTSTEGHFLGYPPWTFWFGYGVSITRWNASATKDWVKLTLLKIMDLNSYCSYIFCYNSKYTITIHALNVGLFTNTNGENPDMCVFYLNV